MGCGSDERPHGERTIDPARLQRWLDPLNEAPVECDGMTRAISALLSINGIEHQTFGGILADDSAVGSEANVGVTHFWIKLADGSTIDYRARMWLGPEAPHGVFQERDIDRFRYVNAEPVQFRVVPLRVLSLMMG